MPKLRAATTTTTDHTAPNSITTFCTVLYTLYLLVAVMGRPLVDLEPHRHWIYHCIYVEKLPYSEVISRLREAHDITIGRRTLMRRLDDWTSNTIDERPLGQKRLTTMVDLEPYRRDIEQWIKLEGYSIDNALAMLSTKHQVTISRGTFRRRLNLWNIIIKPRLVHLRSPLKPTVHHPSISSTMAPPLSTSELSNTVPTATTPGTSTAAAENVISIDHLESQLRLAKQHGLYVNLSQEKMASARHRSFVLQFLAGFSRLSPPTSNEESSGSLASTR